MQKKCKLLKKFPGLPKDWSEGEVLFEYKPIVGFVYYSSIKDNHRLNKDDVENNYEYFEKL